MRWPLAAVLLLATVAPGARAQCPDGTPPPCAGARPALPTVAVRPFTSLSSDTSDAFRAATMTEDLVAALTDAKAARVLADRRARVEWTVSGSVRRADVMVRYVAQVQRRGEVRWTTQLEGPLAHEASLRDSLARGVLGALGIAQRRGRTERTVDPVAYDLWLRGRYYYPRRRERDVAEGIALLQQAVARDPAFARGWMELAKALGWARFWHFPVPGTPAESLLQATLAASERALLLDSSDVDAWLLRANIAYIVDPTTVTIRLAALRRALALDSGNAEAWQQYAIALDEVGDSSGAEAAYTRRAAMAPDEDQAMFAFHFQWYGRRLDTAAVLAQRAVESDPRLMFFREVQAEIALARHRVNEAVAGYQAALRLGEGREQVRALCGLAASEAALGDSARARVLAQRADSIVGSDAPTHHDAIALAGAWAAFGATDHALLWLERYQPRADTHFQLHLRDALLDPLRGEPRFRALQRRPS